MALNRNTFEMTSEGLQELKSELERLKTIDRKRNIEVLKEAREQGDLSENADYDAARDEQARIEARISEIENIIKNVKIIKKDTTDIVTIGKKVEILFEHNKKTETYAIVGSIEADPFLKKISNESPLGKSIIGKRVGEDSDFISETGKEFKITIVNIQ